MSTTTIAVPSDYDEAHAAGWTYHRNGVCGVGFYAKVEADALHIAWSECDEESESFPIAASLPLPLLADLAKAPASDETRTYEWRYGCGGETAWHPVIDVQDGNLRLGVIDMTPDLEDQWMRYVLTVVKTDHPDGDYRYGSLVLSEVLTGDASTTLRGDHFYTWTFETETVR